MRAAGGGLGGLLQPEGRDAAPRKITDITITDKVIVVINDVAIADAVGGVDQGGLLQPD
jgi:hypothetical protein